MNDTPHPIDPISSHVSRIKISLLSFLCGQEPTCPIFVKPLFFTLCITLILVLWFFSQLLLLGVSIYSPSLQEYPTTISHSIDTHVSPIPSLPSYDVHLGESRVMRGNVELDSNQIVEEWNELPFPKNLTWLKQEAQEKIQWPSDIQFEMEWNYLEKEKHFPYIANKRELWNIFPSAQHLPLESLKMDQAPIPITRNNKFVPNTLAVFFGSNNDRRHGLLGLSPTTLTPLYVNSLSRSVSENNSSFSFNTSDNSSSSSFPDFIGLDRNMTDSRNDLCKSRNYLMNKTEYDTSIIVTFKTEPLKIILRALHSILNRTPPALLREIILVDAGSSEKGCRPGELLDTYIKSLPKTKLMRIPEHQGLLMAKRLAFHFSLAPAVVFLSAHIEVSPYWLEPLLEILSKNLHSIAFPQLWSMNSSLSTLYPYQGEGCFYRTSWNLQTISEPIESRKISNFFVFSSIFPHEAFAIRRSWLNQLGNFDVSTIPFTNFNIELSFRNWQCGGVIYCAPCSIVYRSIDHNPKVSSETVEKSRIETATRWLGPFLPLSNIFNSHRFSSLNFEENQNDIVGVQTLNRTKTKLKCMNFKWFIDHVATYLRPRDMTDLKTLGPIRLKSSPSLCLHATFLQANQPLDLSPCSAGNAKQQFMTFQGTSSPIALVADPVLCISENLSLVYCEFRSDAWEIKSDQIALVSNNKRRMRAKACLSVKDTIETQIHGSLIIAACNSAASWIVSEFDIASSSSFVTQG